MTSTFTFNSNTIGNVVAFGVSEERYMAEYAEYFCEWINGTVIKLSPVHDKHDKLGRYITRLLETYLELRLLGEVRIAPFVMRVKDTEGKLVSRREPDIQIILKSNPNTLTFTYMDGAADIVIEIVSPESRDCDYGEKRHQYEMAGVCEYWIVDPAQTACCFYTLNTDGIYAPQAFDDTYESALLPDLKIPIATFWQSDLPSPLAVGQLVQAMIQTEND